MEPPHPRRPIGGFAVGSGSDVRLRLVLDFDHKGNPLQSVAEVYVHGERVAMRGFWPEPFDTLDSFTGSAKRTLDSLTGQQSLF